MRKAARVMNSIQELTNVKKTGIIIAVKDEAAAILSDSAYGWKESEKNIFECGNAILALCGIGKVFASYYTAKISPLCSRILVMGTSGGLSDQRPGDVYLCDEFCEHDMDVSGLGVAAGVTPFCAMKSAVIHTAGEAFAKELTEAAERSALSLKKGRVISGDLFICERQLNDAKRTLFQADLVDMESAAVAKICAFISAREMLALRFVSDNADGAAAGSWQENVKKSSIIFNLILKNLLMPN